MVTAKSKDMCTADLMNGEFVNNLGIQMCLETEKVKRRPVNRREGRLWNGPQSRDWRQLCREKGTCFPPETQLGCSLRSATFDYEAVKIISPF